MMFIKVEYNVVLQVKVCVVLCLLLCFVKFEVYEVFNFYFVSEEVSCEVVKGLLWEFLLFVVGFKCKVIFYDVVVLMDKFFFIVEVMQKYFSVGLGIYYSDFIFFFLVVMYQIMFKEILWFIQLDLDLKFKINIWELFEEFDSFLLGVIIGLVWEMQLVYRYMFWQFCYENFQIRVGGLFFEGLFGFNSGVMLLNLEVMCQFLFYSCLLELVQVQQLVDKYYFCGYFGDQDFFIMIGMEYFRFFYVLDCIWNWQLCIWWRDYGYSDVFEVYFWCEGYVKIYYGNCNIFILEDQVYFCFVLGFLDLGEGQGFRQI